LGVELRLMALLCNDEREAWPNDASAAAGSVMRQRELLSAHLANWAPDYCRQLAARAEHAYVQAIARLTASTLEADLAALDALCPECTTSDA
jgi:TorA maturation chaperone TorD